MKTRDFRAWCFAALLLPLVAGALAAFSCYATTGPPPPACATDPYQPWCPQPIHDERADAGP